MAPASEPTRPDRPYICIFCGASRGARPVYLDAARRVGAAIARAGLGLVYGGGRVGLMGAVADAALEAGGRVVGVIPDPLALREIAHPGLSELHVVPGMHERKALMAQFSDAFLTLPGGVGTYEEFFEVLSWATLGLHAKPFGLLDVEGYFGPLRSLLAHGAAEGFIRPAHLDLLLISSDPQTIAVDLLGHRPPPPGPVWIDLEQT